MTDHQLGASLTQHSARFAIHAEHATAVDLCFFDNADRETSRQRMTKQGVIFAISVKDVKPGQRYGYRAHGSWAPESGHRFDHSKVLLDPYAVEIDRHFHFNERLSQHGFDTAAIVPKAILRSPLSKVPLRAVKSPDFIYEVNVRALTKLHPHVPEQQRGTVAALSSPRVIEHIKSLGVDTIELMPLTAWMDERHLPPLGLSNAWGYNPVSFLAPDPRLAPGGLHELRTTVARLHDAGFNVVLDIVFNHTAESDAQGPTISFRGLDNATYYRLAGGSYINDTGCGNTMALDHPVCVDLCIAALLHWVEYVGIDGFRFDLATVMGREPLGFRKEAPLLAAIAAHPILSSRIMIAEPWDIGPGGYQLGNFPAAWHEWNDKYRDDVRRFWRGDQWSANALATRLTGSSDVMSSKAGPSRSINFISAHDGFTLKDVVTYGDKDNHANGENNRDGKNGEATWVKGDVRALLATLFLSRGTPMITAGDEFGRTQKGNNNAYAQDNSITWIDWENADKELAAFVASLAQLRARVPELAGDKFLSDHEADWFDSDGAKLEWNRPDVRFVGLAIKAPSRSTAIVVNGSNQVATLNFEPSKKWQRIFCSSAGDHCPPCSVSLFEERHE
jgi:glycogen debranching enzyme